MKNHEKMKKAINKYFDKDNNYNDIIQEIDKVKSNNNIWKYSLIPICLIVVIGGFIFTNFNNSNYNKNDFIYEKSFIEGKNIITSSTSSDQYDKVLSDDFATLVNNSDAVIKGKVVSVNYEPIEGNAWTRIKFHIDEVINGNIKTNQDIDIYYIGGYITLEDHIKYNDDAFRFKDLSEDEIKNTVFKEIVDGEETFVKKGEELILCIVKTSDNSPLPKNSYERLYSSGMLKLRGNKYVQLYGEVKEKYSVDKDKLNDIKKLIK